MCHAHYKYVDGSTDTSRKMDSTFLGPVETWSDVVKGGRHGEMQALSEKAKKSLRRIRETTLQNAFVSYRI